MSIPLTAHLVLIMSLQTTRVANTATSTTHSRTCSRWSAGAPWQCQRNLASRAALPIDAQRLLQEVPRRGSPIESRLSAYAQDFFNAEIVARTIDDKQAAVDILLWTLMYRRLQQNPRAYNCQAVKHAAYRRLPLGARREHTGRLENSKCIAIEDEMDVSPLNLGMIASFYNVSYVTVDVFNCR